MLLDFVSLSELSEKVKVKIIRCAIQNKYLQENIFGIQDSFGA